MPKKARSPRRLYRLRRRTVPTFMLANGSAARIGDRFIDPSRKRHRATGHARGVHGTARAIPLVVRSAALVEPRFDAARSALLAVRVDRGGRLFDGAHCAVDGGDHDVVLGMVLGLKALGYGVKVVPVVRSEACRSCPGEADQCSALVRRV